MSQQIESLLRYRAGHGEPLVLLPGLGTDWMVWAPVLPELSRHADVLALDLPGLGRPPVRRTEPSIEALTTEVCDELDRLGVSEPLVAGSSLGGWVALELARRHVARAAVAIAPGGLAFGAERAYAVASMRVTGALARLFRPVAPVLSSSTAFRTWFFAQTRSRPWQVPPDVAAAEMAVMADSPAHDELARRLIARQTATDLAMIDRPVVLLWGSRDRLLPAYQARRFLRRIPGARLEVLPGAGHVPMTDAPQAVAAAILRAAR
jgi:pimeloyl-ACP methyl ester carboxylesterase